METQGTFSQDAYFDLVEEILEERREMGELDDDDDIEEYKEQLRHRWEEAKANLESGHDRDVLEQE